MYYIHSIILYTMDYILYTHSIIYIYTSVYKYCLYYVPCLVCYSGKEAPCLFHRVTAIAVLYTSSVSSAEEWEEDKYMPFGNDDLS